MEKTLEYDVCMPCNHDEFHRTRKIWIEHGPRIDHIYELMFCLYCGAEWTMVTGMVGHRLEERNTTKAGFKL